MRIANPIYDSVFKFLMDNETVARGLLGRLIDCEILELTLIPQETADLAANSIGDSQAMVRIYRLDFAAVVKGADGVEHKVLIELQKAGRTEAVTRFRNYLARHYSVKGKGHESYPIIAIYFLGFRVDTVPGNNRPEAEMPGVVRVKRRYLNASTGEEWGGKRVDFIEKLTHDAVVVQIPQIPKLEPGPLRNALEVFNQAYQMADSQYLNLPADVEQSNDPLVSAAVRQLLMAAADPETQQKMELEDELSRIVGGFDEAKLEIQEERRQKEQALAQKEQALAREEQARLLAERAVAEAATLREELEQLRAKLG
jgi:hypothetical protein